MTLFATLNLPNFGMLTAIATVTFSTLMGSIPILPFVFPGHPVRYPSFCLLSFVAPTLPVYILLTYKRFPKAHTVLRFCANITAVASFTILALVSTQPYIVGLCLAYVLLGVAHSALQATAPFVVVDSLDSSSESRRRYYTGLHLAFLNVSTALGAVVTPPFFALLAVTSVKANPTVVPPFVLAATTHGLLAVTVFFSTQKGLLSTGPSVSERTPLLGAASSRGAPRFDERVPVKRILRHPWAWLVFLSMFATNGIMSFLRPLLAPVILQSSHGVMKASFVFGLVTATSLLAEVVIPSFIAPQIGTRTTLVLGIILVTIGSHILDHVPISAAFCIIAFGAATVPVIALSDLALTTNDIIDYSTPASMLVLSLITTSDIIAYLTVTALPDSQGSNFVSHAAAILSPIMFTVSVAVVVPYVLGLVVSRIVPVVMLFRSSGPAELSVQEPQRLHLPATLTPERPLISL